MSLSKWRKIETISDRNYKIPFGAFKGKTIQEVLDSENPGYILWLNENTNLDFHYTILDEAEGVGSQWKLARDAGATESDIY